MVGAILGSILAVLLVTWSVVQAKLDGPVKTQRPVMDESWKEGAPIQRSVLPFYDKNGWKTPGWIVCGVLELRIVLKD